MKLTLNSLEMGCASLMRNLIFKLCLPGRLWINSVIIMHKVWSLIDCFHINSTIDRIERKLINFLV